MGNENYFVQLSQINVNEHVEKKGTLSYLSWAWAVDQLLRCDPMANWEYNEPKMHGETMMVFCTVTAFGTPRTMQLPVMDHRNDPIANPDAFQVNTAMQRCLVKAIALHGLGLYIYAGEDLPHGESPSAPAPTKVTPIRQERTITPAQLRYLHRLIVEAKSSEEHIKDYFNLDRFEDLPMKEFDRALQALRRSA